MTTSGIKSNHMNMFKNILFLLVAIVAFSSCEEIFMKSNPKTDNLAIFDEYADLVREKYAMLDFKGVDIDFLSDSIRSTITSELGNEELFNKLGIITSRLRDGHSNLSEAGMNDLDENSLSVNFDLLEGYPDAIDLDILFENYIDQTTNPSMKTLEGDGFLSKVTWGVLNQDTDIGYIWIPSWDVEISEDEIEMIFFDLKDTKGLIFDMRLNGGGDPSLATTFASYFTDMPIYTGFERFKTGPGLNDFSDSPVTLQPADSENKYLKPVAVLIDRNVYSASTTFSYSVFPLETMTFIGQRAGGGSGSVADGYLANGWHWSLSVSEFIDYQNRHLDDGFDPDIMVELDATDISKDELIERAIQELQ